MTSAILQGKPDVGNPYIRFDEGEVASMKPRRGPLLYKKLFFLFFVLPLVAVAGEVTATSVTAQQHYPWNGLVDITVTIQGSADDMAVTECTFAATNSATKAEILVAHVMRNGDDVGSGGAWTRKYVWDAKADVGVVKIDDVALSVEAFAGAQQLWENGPYWSTCNVGAMKPEESGYYFWWGDTVGYKLNASNNGWVSANGETGFSFNEGNCPTYGKNNSQLQLNGYIDATGNLVAAHDAATAHLGALWRMPTDAEFFELIDNCDMEWTSCNGVSGRLVKGRGAYASKSIFLPAAGYGRVESHIGNLGSYGYYLSSTPNSDFAWCLYFSSSDNMDNMYGSDRSSGHSVRPVRGFARGGIATSGEAATHLMVDCRILTSVTAQQRYPWNGLVDIAVTLRGAAEDMNVTECSFAATNSATKAAIPVMHITRNGNDAGSDSVWTRKFIWDAKADVGAVKIDDVALTVDTKLMGVQLWENGPYWAEYNVGATKPEESGYYFWWGDTVGYKRNASNNGWVSVKEGTEFSFCSGNCPTYGKNNSQLQTDGYIDATGNLVASHDAATAHFGVPWRMPTEAEIFDLINNCDTEWTSCNGVSGRLVKGRGAYASKSIFLPFAGIGGDSGVSDLERGNVWSSTPSTVSSFEARHLHFYSGYFYCLPQSRYYGQSVRPVRGFAK